MTNSLVIFVTNNKVTKCAIYKETSDSLELLELVIEFYALQMEFSFICIVIHIAQTQMITQGGNGLSRGNMNKGVMSGTNFLLFLPLSETAIKRSPNIIQWIHLWINATNPIFLQPEQWFDRAHNIVGNSLVLQYEGDKRYKPNIKSGVYIWIPPPAAADVALEESRKARIKKQDLMDAYHPDTQTDDTLLAKATV